MERDKGKSKVHKEAIAMPERDQDGMVMDNVDVLTMGCCDQKLESPRNHSCNALTVRAQPNPRNCGVFYEIIDDNIFDEWNNKNQRISQFSPNITPTNLYTVLLHLKAPYLDDKVLVADICALPSEPRDGSPLII
jgi:hypothetical protein